MPHSCLKRELLKWEGKIDQCDTQIETAHWHDIDCKLNCSRSMANLAYTTMEETIELCAEKTRVDISLSPVNLVIISRYAKRFREQ